MTSCIVVPEMPVMTNRFRPIGGVMAAISILSVRTIAKWMRLISSAFTVGSSSGVTTVSSVKPSRKQPSTINMALTRNRNPSADRLSA